MYRSLMCFFVVTAISSCNQQVPPPTAPLIVRAGDLARVYRSDPSAAELAYTGQVVHVFVNDATMIGNDLHWHLGDKQFPSTIVFQFSEHQRGNVHSVWVIGTCRGATYDGVQREFTGYTFYVLITDCRIVPPPTRQVP